MTARSVLSLDVGVENLAYAIVNVSAGKCHIVRWRVVNIMKELGSTYESYRKIPVPVLIRMLVLFLRHEFQGTQTRKMHQIVIEQQNARSPAQRKMVHVSYALFQYFFSLNPSTQLISAGTKFNRHVVCGGRFTIPKFVSPKFVGAKSTQKKKEYQARKNNSVQVASDFLGIIHDDHLNNASWVEWYRELQKKDDAAESLILALVASQL